MSGDKFITTIRVCTKCRHSLITSKNNLYFLLNLILRFILLHLQMDGEISLFPYVLCNCYTCKFLNASHSQYSDLKDDFDTLAEKYNYRLNDLYYNKNKMQTSDIHTQMNSLFQSLYIYIYIYNIH